MDSALASFLVVVRDSQTYFTSAGGSERHGEGPTTELQVARSGSRPFCETLPRPCGTALICQRQYCARLLLVEFRRRFDRLWRGRYDRSSPWFAIRCPIALDPESGLPRSQLGRRR